MWRPRLPDKKLRHPWRRVADGTWLLLLVGFGVYVNGWALTIWNWNLTRWHAATVAALMGAIETALLVNRETRDTLSERLRLLTRRRPFVALAIGELAGAALTVATHWPVYDEARWILRALFVITEGLGLLGHFFNDRHVDAPVAPKMRRAFAWGLSYGAVMTLWAFQPVVVQDPEAMTLVFWLAALLSVRLGGEFFTLTDGPETAADARQKE